MKVELVDNSDDQFKIKVKQPSVVAEEPEVEETVEEVPEQVVVLPPPGERYVAKQPVPLENKKGLDWFNGTSWGNQ